MKFFGVVYTINDGERLKEGITRQFDLKNAVDIVSLQNKKKFSIFMELGEMVDFKLFDKIKLKTGENSYFGKE